MGQHFFCGILLIRDILPRMKGKNTGPKARSPGQAQTSISLDERVLDAGRRVAAEQKRSFSKFIELLIEERLKEARIAEKSDGRKAEKADDA